MDVRVETTYNQETLTAMARALRKSIRKRRNRITKVFALFVIILGFFAGIGFYWLGVTASVDWLSLFAAILVLVVLLYEDKLNGKIAGRRLVPGTQEAIATFSPLFYQFQTQAAVSQWNYGEILILCESSHYFILILSKYHAQALDKRRITGGTAEELAKFLTQKTGLSIIPV